MKTLWNGNFGEGHLFAKDRDLGYWRCSICGATTADKNRVANAKAQFRLKGHSLGRHGKTSVEKRMERRSA